MTEFEAEWGSSIPLRFANVRCYDSEGNEIIVPKCDKCGYHKCQVIGKQSFTYICLICQNN